MSHELKTPEEAAKVLKVSVRTLAKWRCTDEVKIPYIKVGRSVRYKLSDLDKYIEQNTVHGEAA